MTIQMGNLKSKTQHEHFFLCMCTVPYDPCVQIRQNERTKHDNNYALSKANCVGSSDRSNSSHRTSAATTVVRMANGGIR